MKKRIIQIVLALLALVAAVVGARYWQNNYLSGVSMVKIPVPLTDIPPYTLLSADMFVVQEFPRALADIQAARASTTDQSVYVLSTADLEGSMSVETLMAGLPVAKRMAIPPGQFRLAAPGLEVISLPADATNTVGGQVRIGEMVNIYCLKAAPKQDETLPDAPPPEPEVIFVARVPVVAVFSDNGLPLSAGGENEQPQPMRILVVAAPHETVQSILDAIALTKLEGSFIWVTLATP